MVTNGYQYRPVVTVRKKCISRIASDGCGLVLIGSGGRGRKDGSACVGLRRDKGQRMEMKAGHLFSFI